jgi:hypothetical protein
MLTTFPQLTHRRSVWESFGDGHEQQDRARKPIAYRTIARKIGVSLREVYSNPEAEPLPAEHVDLLLQLRHKERNQGRRGS